MTPEYLSIWSQRAGCAGQDRRPSQPILLVEPSAVKKLTTELREDQKRSEPISKGGLQSSSATAKLVADRLPSWAVQRGIKHLGPLPTRPTTVVRILREMATMTVCKMSRRMVGRNLVQMLFIKISMLVLRTETLQWTLTGDCRRTISNYFLTTRYAIKCDLPSANQAGCVMFRASVGLVPRRLHTENESRVSIRFDISLLATPCGRDPIPHLVDNDRALRSFAIRTRYQLPHKLFRFSFVVLIGFTCSARPRFCAISGV